MLELKDVRIDLKYKTHLWLCPGAVIHIDSDVQFTSPGNEHLDVQASVELSIYESNWVIIEEG